MLLVIYVPVVLLKPLSDISPPPSSQLQLKTAASNFSWPASGQAAVSTAGSEPVVAHGQQTPVPIASVAKVITALVVLDRKPLSAGQQGPTLILTDRDVELYRTYVAGDGSVVPVQAGEQISQYQALVAVMLPSSNNLADTLAMWAYGSLPNYAAAANKYLKVHGLTSTTVGNDASGYDPSTVSTARDLVKLAKLAMAQPVLAEIAAKSTSDEVPLAGTVRNVNILLGTSGIIGLKTGNTDQAGGVFVGAARHSVNSKPVTIVTAIAGTPDLATALQTTVPLVQSAQQNFKTLVVTPAGAIVGRYQLPWGGSVPVATSKAVNVTAWGGSVINATINLYPLPPTAQKGEITGLLVVPKSAFADEVRVPLVLQDRHSEPSLWWRLTHPLGGQGLEFSTQNR